MKAVKTKIEGLYILEPKVFGDDRGYFMETFNKVDFKNLTGLEVDFVQDNESMSSKGVLRGLHFQKPPMAQGKLVRVVKGAVLDVAVDIRENSPTYGSYEKVLLTEQNKRQFWIPEGFAHGFLTLEDHTIFNYKCTNYYSPKDEGSILWNDSDLAIDWTIDQPILSEKDKLSQNFTKFSTPF